MREKFLYGSAFAILLLRARHADETVLKIQFWTPVISFSIELGLMTPWTEITSPFVENWY